MKAAKKNNQLIDTSTEVSLQEKTFLVHGTQKVPIRAKVATKFSLFFRYLENHPISDPDQPVNLLIRNNGKSVELGPCRILPETEPNGYAGRLVFLREIYDIGSLFNDNKVVKLQSAFHDLPLIFARKENLKPAFKDYVADLKYDLQVYKSLFDDLDSKYSREPQDVKSTIEKAIIETEGPGFRQFFENKLDELKCLVHDFSLEEHQRHGNYFRKQLWGLILCCPFTGRATLKPRNYPGDSGLMRMVYLNDYQGNSTYAKLTHKHAVEHAASQSVRYRIVLIGEMLNKYQNCRDEVAQEKIKVLSVGCGSAFELKNILETPQDCEKYNFTLFDQDAKALSEAAELVNHIGDTLSVTPVVDYVQGSVRTMLFSRKLRQKWGQFHFIYSLGLFDYLAPRVAKAVLNRLFQLLAPDGEMIVGNFHVSNASRYYMMYWGDWFLYHRTEEELGDICDKSPNDKTSVLYDSTGSQMFLHIQKQKNS
jgi:extracellular factor (EF) 3-hydroxypalmitic acid methyl ester biosynthesis protein